MVNVKESPCVDRRWRHLIEGRWQYLMARYKVIISVKSWILFLLLHLLLLLLLPLLSSVVRSPTTHLTDRESASGEPKDARTRKGIVRKSRHLIPDHRPSPKYLTRALFQPRKVTVILQRLWIFLVLHIKHLAIVAKSKNQIRTILLP